MLNKDLASTIFDTVVVGGGPAGMAAALASLEAGAKDVLVVEREPKLGGILEQCIHNGFGLHKFKEELTGPEYAERYENMVKGTDISYLTNTMVIAINEEKADCNTVTIVNKELGYRVVKTKTIVLAMGCREKSRGALAIPGTRPAGVFSAGTAQKIVNIKGYMPGKKVVILGSGDIGLIMARRMTLEGAEVKAVCEIMKDSGGLTRNIVQCLNDFNIPLKLSTTVIDIKGKDRVEGVTIAKVDENLKPIAGTEEYIDCDALMLSVGLIPENELTRKAGIEINPKTRGPVVDYNCQTTCPGVFACGNVVKVHELVDFVSDQGEIAGFAAGCFATGKPLPTEEVIEAKTKKQVEQKKGVKNLSQDGENAVICTICPNGCRMLVTGEEGNYEVSGNLCKRGVQYAINEMTKPSRTLTTTVLGSDGSLIPVKSDKPIPKELLAEAVEIINKKTLVLPVEMGQVVVEDIVGTGANIVCTKSFK